MVLLVGTGAFAQGYYSSSTGEKYKSGKNERNKPKGESKFDINRLMIGGGLGLQFGQVTNIAIAPRVGYQFTDFYSAGVGLGYNYFRFKNYGSYPNLYTQRMVNINLVSNNFSASIWNRVSLFNILMLHAEFEGNYMRTPLNIRYNPDTGDPEVNYQNAMVPSLLLGGGLRQQVSDYSYLYVMALYDVLQRPFSPYGNTIFFNMGIMVGL